ncbi:O-acyltransferase WSD1-like isoform X2 [Asparagus officinalis]|nr:O-acyltransferase WSD1-like isoform X2 [Asparagus officinalis]
MHLIKYPTKTSKGTLVFKLHHALGDGFSLMAALFSCIKRADDPSLPLTFPSTKITQKMTKSVGAMSYFGKVSGAFSACGNTVKDFGWSLMKSNFLEDDKTPVRSGTVGVEYLPISIVSVQFPLDDVREIKMKIGGTVNDVISGIIFHGVQLYLQSAAKDTTESAKVTALVLLNTRIIGSYQPLHEMTKTGAKSPWGNQFGFLHVGIPNCRDAEKVNPLEFVQKAREIIKQKRSSLAVYFTGRLLEMLRRLIGPEGTAKYIHSTLRNTSMTISNLTGPMEQMIIANNPISSFYFMVVGVPQSLTITVVSYMGKLRVAMGVEKGFINPNLLVSCMEKSFERIFEAALGMKP